MKIKETSILLLLLIITQSLFAQWQQIGQSLIGDTTENYFGWSVSISGNGLVLAATAPQNNENANLSGQVKVFDFSSGQWLQLGNDILGDTAEAGLGESVSLSYDGHTMVLGSITYDGNGFNCGLVKVFEFDGTDWVQKGNDIIGEMAGELTGNSVSISTDGNIIAIGAPKNTEVAIEGGKVRVFEYNGTEWQQLGTDINGQTYSAHLGTCVSLSSDASVLAVGAPDANDTGYVKVFNYNGSDWSQIGDSISANNPYWDFGKTVSLNSDGSILAIGAFIADTPYTYSSNQNGLTVVYKNNSGNWEQMGQRIWGETSDYLGYSVDLSSDGMTLASGGVRTIGTDNGLTRVFSYNGINWVQLSNDIIIDDFAYRSGFSVSISDDGAVVAIGSPYSDADNTGVVNVFSFITNISEIGNNIRIYPNPTNSNIYIEGVYNNTKLVVYDISGNKLLETQSDNIDLSQLNKGVYFISILNENHIYTRKIIKL